MEYSKNFNFALPSRDNDVDLADINEIGNNFRKIDEQATKKEFFEKIQNEVFDARKDFVGRKNKSVGESVRNQFGELFDVVGTGKNLFNPTDPDIIVGKLFDSDGNPTVTNGAYIISGYIPVDEGKTYRFSFVRGGVVIKNYARQYAMYDENKNLVSIETAETTGARTIPTGVKYVRVAFGSPEYATNPSSEFLFVEGDLIDYEPFHYVFSLSKNVELPVEETEEIVVLSARWCAMGDSITEGYYSYIDDDGTGKFAMNPNESWAYKVAQINKYDLTNKGVGGSGFVSIRSEANPVANARMVADATDFSEFDFVTLAFGVNDWKYNCALGTLEDDVATGGTIYSNMRYVIEKILSDNPMCKIIVITPINCSYFGTYETNYGLGYSFPNNGTLEDIYNAQKEVCEYYGIEMIDMTHKSIVNRFNINNVLHDGVHPSTEGLNAMARELSKKINFANSEETTATNISPALENIIVLQSSYIGGADE